MKEVLKYRNQIYGLCAIWIVLFHIQRRLGFPEIPIITPLLEMGNLGVDIFMFLSGYCLCLSFKRNNDLRRFFGKRVTRVVIPYLIITTPYLLYKSFVVGKNMSFLIQVKSFFVNLTGLSFWIDGFQTSWFVHAIIVLYCLFPFFYYIVSKGKLSGIALIVLTYLFVLVNYCYSPIFEKNAIALCRFPVFILGILMAYHNWDVALNKRNLIISLIYLIILIWIIPTKKVLSGFFSYGYTSLFLFFITMVIPSMVLMVPIVKRSKGFINQFFLFTGGLSLEIYMIHIMILNIMRDYSFIQEGVKVNSLEGCAYYLLVIILTSLLAYGFSIFTKKFIISRIEHSKE